MSMNDSGKGGSSERTVVVTVVRTFPLMASSTLPRPSRPRVKGTWMPPKPERFGPGMGCAMPSGAKMSACPTPPPVAEMVALGSIRYSLKMTKPGGVLAKVTAIVGAPMMIGLRIGDAWADIDPAMTPSRMAASARMRFIALFPE
jgi:hypothetical protein